MWLSRRRWMIAGIFAVAIISAAGSFAISQTRHTVSARTRITVQATPIDVFDVRDKAKTRFGALEFRGGLVLTSSDGAFGGLSALHMEPDGVHFLAVTDLGSWFQARIVYRNGRPAGIANAEMAPMLGIGGKPLSARGRFDSEALTEIDGIAYVGVERLEQIVRFDYRRFGLRAHGEPIPVPPDFKTLSPNGSLECLAAAPDRSALSGHLIVVTEHSLDADGNLRSFLLKGREAERFAVKRIGEYDVSDCTILPSGDLLLLERSFSILRGLGVRLRRIPLGTIKPGALVDGPVLFEADLSNEIDNMEGIGVHRNGRGETILTLVSDDNFSPIQRTLLLQFAIVGE